MRCTRSAVDNQSSKGCGHGYEDTNEYRGKKEEQWVGSKKNCEGGHVNPHRVTRGLVESQSNFTLQERLV